MHIKAFLKRFAPFAPMFVLLMAGLSSFLHRPLSDDDRRRALELYGRHNLAGALPQLERLAEERPKDATVHGCLGSAVLVVSAGIRDPATRRRERLRARQILIEARDLGDHSNWLRDLLQEIPADGHTAPFSENIAVEAIMRDAEAAYARGDTRQALDGYAKAFAREPQLYQAPLFAGDACTRLRDYPRAGEWYARAVQIDPNAESAYRYWGVTLMEAGDMRQARERFIDALVAEPYDNDAWTGADHWAGRNNLAVAFPKVTQPPAGTDPSGAWSVYEVNRAAWPAGRFAREFPAEKQYRHTVKEETESLRLVARRARQLPKLDANLALLVKLDGQGLLEPYILIAAVDHGTKQDYLDYRAAHREKVRQFLDQYIVPKLP